MAADDDDTNNTDSVIKAYDRFQSNNNQSGNQSGSAGSGNAAPKWQQQWRQFHSSKNHGGKAATFENAITAIDQLGIECRYDIFHDRILVRGHQWQQLEVGDESLDHVALKVRCLIVDTYGFDPGPDNTRAAITKRALDNTFDPVLDYLNGLQWDGVPRLDKWLHTHLGAEDNKLNQAIGRKMLIAAVRRVRQPGCKFDYIPIMDNSKQGKGKSTVIQILAGEENFSDQDLLALSVKEQQEQIQGVWLYELSDLSGLQKTDINKVKSFASRQVDRARPAYGRSRVDRKRRGIQIGTTNDLEYLQDMTGNRRFWPFTPGEIDVGAVRRDRDQLWAEAAAAEAAGEALIIPEELWGEIEERQASRMIPDPWEDLLGDGAGDGDIFWNMIKGVDYVQMADKNGAPQWRVKSAALMSKKLGFTPDRMNSGHSRRLGAVVRKLGWEGPDTMKFGAKSDKGYCKPV
jgi:predicted P-loop ATPase